MADGALTSGPQLGPPSYFEDGTADVLDCDGRTTVFRTVDEARSWLSEDEFVLPSGIDAADLVALGLSAEDLVPPDTRVLDVSALYRKRESAELIRDLGAYTLPEPWVAVDPQHRELLERELKRELHRSHPLSRRPARAMARRLDRDEVLFVVEAPAALAVVHLTYCKSPPERPPWPTATLYKSAHEFVDSALADALEDGAV